MMDPLGLLFENGGLSAGGVLAAVVAALITYVFNAHLDRQAQRRGGAAAVRAGPAAPALWAALRYYTSE